MPSFSVTSQQWDSLSPLEMLDFIFHRQVPETNIMEILREIYSYTEIAPLPAYSMSNSTTLKISGGTVTLAMLASAFYNLNEYLEDRITLRKFTENVALTGGVTAFSLTCSWLGQKIGGRMGARVGAFLPGLILAVSIELARANPPPPLPGASPNQPK
jgi:hypothetical protein